VYKELSDPKYLANIAIFKKNIIVQEIKEE